MVVKRLTGGKSKGSKMLRPARTRVSVDLTGLALPTAPKEIDRDLSHYIILLYGREKIGKTKAFSSFPNTLFAATEPGTKGLSIYEFNWEKGGVTSWPIFVRMVDLLVAVPAVERKIKHVCVDTADRAYDMCLDWVCEERSIEYPGQDSAGDEDYGKSWRAVKQEFLSQIYRLVQSGYGVSFTSHSKEETIKTRSGIKYTRIFPSMGNQARSVIEALVDFFFYAEYVKIGASGETKRVLICQGDETIWAGAREGCTDVFPQFLPLEKDGEYNIIRRAFLGEYKGLDPALLRPTKSTTQTAEDFIKRRMLAGKRASITEGGVRPKKILPRK